MQALGVDILSRFAGGQAMRAQAQLAAQECDRRQPRLEHPLHALRHNHRSFQQVLLSLSHSLDVGYGSECGPSLVTVASAIYGSASILISERDHAAMYRPASVLLTVASQPLFL